ncbi:1-acyl-sn-glycerol-3-phosphate acyltransferase [bacterium]|nr:1-acyl-sn-glycerol-3-phosphate acyltransferase [bacterium]
MSQAYPVPTKPFFITTLCRTLLRLLYRLEGRGLENLPWGRGAIFAPNHSSYIDPVAVNVLHKKPMNFMAKHDLFTGRFGRAIFSYGAFPVNMDKNDPGAYRMALAALKDGNWLCLFPEGQRSDDGQLQPLREGIGRLAIKAGVPVIPVRIDGAHEAWPRGGWPRLSGKVIVTFFPAIEPPQEIGSPAEREQAVQNLMEQVRQIISVPADKLLPAPAKR